MYSYNIYDDNTMEIKFTENGEEISSKCGIQDRYLKVFPKDSKDIKATRMSSRDTVYYDTTSKTYYISDIVYRGTIIEVYADGQGALIEDVPGYYYQKAIYSAYKYKPLSYIGEVSQDKFKNIEDTGYMRVSQQTALYDLKGEKYSYLTEGCTFPENKNSIYRFFVSTDGNVILSDIEGYTVSTCKVAKRYQLVKGEDIENLNASVVNKSGFYFSQDSGKYYKSVYFEKGSIVSTFGDGQIAYIKDINGYYHWEPIFEVLKPIQ